MIEWMPLLLFGCVLLLLMSGYPVAFVLGGTALAFAFIGEWSGLYEASTLIIGMVSRIKGIMSNDILIAVPAFVFMGIMLERSRIAEGLLEAMAQLFRGRRGGIGISVTLVGMLLAASTGIVGATVVTMGLLSLPTMLKRGYDPAVATGTICASGTLGQIIPPSIILVLLGDVLSSAYQQAQRDMGIFSPTTVSVGDLFMGAVFPGLLLVGLYLLYQIGLARLKPDSMPALPEAERVEAGWALWKHLLLSLAPPLLLITLVLGSIFSGAATSTEAASLGALGAIVLAACYRRLNLATLRETMRGTTRVSSMVFMILIGATAFSAVFRDLGGDELVRHLLTDLPGGTATAIIAVMIAMFLLGFVLDFIEITFIVVPIVGPILLAMGVDPVWLGVMIALNLQTSFLTPPFGFALFYLRGVAPDSVPTRAIYRGVIPFILIQLLAMGVIAAFPTVATWLPQTLN
ncbi:trap-type transport system, large permease component [gamma proteobacterium HTCC5015]|nr:trap-type transport system, large permease component [gamma proteobacterium HTCC5015]